MPVHAGSKKKMADPQEFNSLDELFRKTFDDLPDTAAPSGWDTPSPRVWDQVQVRLKPPRSGWSTQTILLVSSLAITLMLGLYWALSTPDQPAATPSVANPEQSVVAAAPENSPMVDSPAEIPKRTAPNTRPAGAATEKLSPPAPRSVPTPASATPVESTLPAAPNSTERNSEEPGRLRPSGSVPLPGSRPASPNTTVLRQAEQWRVAPWAKPLSPLPSTLEIQFIRPVPESLKNLFKPGNRE